MTCAWTVHVELKLRSTARTVHEAHLRRDCGNSFRRPKRCRGWISRLAAGMISTWASSRHLESPRPESLWDLESLPRLHRLTIAASTWRIPGNGPNWPKSRHPASSDPTKNSTAYPGEYSCLRPRWYHPEESVREKLLVLRTAPMTVSRRYSG